jgi:hypothetical protein
MNTKTGGSVWQQLSNSLDDAECNPNAKVGRRYFDNTEADLMPHYPDHKPTPCHAGFTHNGQQWDITCSLWCGLYRVIIECEGEQVGKRTFAPTREMIIVVGDVIIDIFGTEYGL